MRVKRQGLTLLAGWLPIAISISISIVTLGGTHRAGLDDPNRQAGCGARSDQDCRSVTGGPPSGGSFLATSTNTSLENSGEVLRCYRIVERHELHGIERLQGIVS
jgi:hypothetical protein